MAYREVHGVEIQEIIRRWQAGLSQRRIASGMGLSRQTVRRYIDAAEAAGLTPDGPEPSEEQLAALATLSLSGPRQVEAPSEELLSPWAEQIERWLETDRLQLTRIQELLAGRGCEVSYTTLRRFIRRRGWRHRLPSTVRMDDGPPGEVAEMDFGRLGFIRDPESGRRRAVWALVVVWRYSRHCFVWPTTSQKLDAVIEGLEEAWAFFGGVPRYLVIDNFPAAVAGADALHPRFTRGFLEYARHRGFITDPARVRHPRDKPRVERSIPYVRERLFKGGDFRDVVDLRSAARSWCLEVAGQRIHGTTRRRPLEVFREEELPLLAPWDGEPYEVPDWRTATVHPDHHIACQYALYSVPSTACPPRQKVEVQLGSKLVRIYHRGQLIKVHPRQRRGGRATDPNDYPAELTPYTRRAPDWIQRRAAELGEAVGAYAERLFEGSLPWAKLRQGHKLLRLASATPRTASTPPAAARSRSTSSTCAASSASSSRPSTRRAPQTSPSCRRLRGASPTRAPSSHSPARRPRQEHHDDRHHLRPPSAAQAPQARPHARHVARAHRPRAARPPRLRGLPADPARRRGEPPRPRAVGAAPAPGRLRAALPPRGLRLGGRHPARPRLLDAAFSLHFLDRREHVLLVGPVGVGKSFLAQALGYSAVRSGRSVRFAPADHYFREMAQARVDHSAEKVFRSFLAPDLLILDDLGLHRLSAQQSIDLYELVIGRHRSSSFVITSNRAVEEWLGLFDDPILGNSALDRLANASYQIVIEGDSYRQRLSPHRALLEAQTGGD